MARWLVRPTGSGQEVEVMQGRRRVGTAPTKDEGLDLAQQQMTEGDTLHSEAEDGYRTRERGRRRHWRSPTHPARSSVVLSGDCDTEAKARLPHPSGSRAFCCPSKFSWGNPWTTPKNSW
jgi:hypothetical protein